MTYVYESHMGGIFFTDHNIGDTYCEQCGDFDWLLGFIDTEEDLKELLDNEYSDEYSDDYIGEVLKEYRMYINNSESDL